MRLPVSYPAVDSGRNGHAHSDCGGEELYEWSFPGAPIRICLALPVVHALRETLIQRGAGAEAECAGLLLGAVPSAHSVVIRDYKLLNPAGSDGKDLKQVVAASEQDEHQVVGCFRTDVRGEITLRASDVEFIREVVPDPARVFLVIDTSAGDPGRAGFFFWDRDHIHTAFSFLEFPFDAVQLGLEVNLTRSCELGADRELTLASTPARRGITTRSSRQRWPWLEVLSVALAAASFVAGFQTARSGKSAPSPPLLGLSVERRGADWHITWNRRLPAVTNAVSGVLMIHARNAESRSIQLTVEDLRIGSIFYAGASRPVGFLLESHTPEGRMRESVVVVASDKKVETASEAYGF